MRQLWSFAVVVVAFLLMAASPALAGGVPLHELVEQGKVRVEVTATNGYTSADVRIINLTGEYLEIEPTGSALVPTETTAGKYTQRLATTTPANYGPNDKMTVGPQGTWTGRLRTCCMDLGKPAPTTAGPYKKVTGVPQNVQQAMEYWRQHPEITQDAVNRVIWGMTRYEDLVSGFTNGTCPRRNINDPIEPRHEYPQDAVEWQAENDRIAREAEELLAREERRMDWTPVLEGEAGDDPAVREGGEKDKNFLEEALKSHFEAASARCLPVVVFVMTEREDGDWEAINKACHEFMNRVLLDEKVAGLLKGCMRLKLEISRVPSDVARDNQLHGRRAPQLMLYDYEGKLRYRVQGNTPAEAAARLSRLIGVVERMADKE